MAKPSLSFVSLALVLLFHGCLARQVLDASQFRHECQLDQLTALEPTTRLQYEGGESEIWDHNSPQLRCAGVTVLRHVIQANALFLPTFHSAPTVSYVVRGNGVIGKVFPGCAETFQASRVQPHRQSQGGQGQQGQQGYQGQQGQQGQQGHQGQFPGDIHQRVDRLRQGDIIALPAGVAHWVHNDGDQPLVIVTLLDLANQQNQLDRFPRSFFLAGSLHYAPQSQQAELIQKSSLLGGFDPKLMALAFNIDLQTAQKFRNQHKKGNIIKVGKGFSAIIPPPSRAQGGDYESSQDNGLEETVCTQRFVENIDDPSRADVYKPQLGRITTLNSYDLPILAQLRLSALRGVIQPNAIILPQWNINADAILFVTRGRARVQVVNDNGQTVFDDVVSNGRILTIPQGFGVIKQAQSEGFEWITFKTNDKAMVNTLAGRTSVMRALPLEVISNGFQVSMEEARQIKFNTLETTLTRGRSSQGQGGGRAEF